MRTSTYPGGVEVTRPGCATGKHRVNNVWVQCTDPLPLGRGVAQALQDIDALVDGHETKLAGLKESFVGCESDLEAETKAVAALGTALKEKTRAAELLASG